MNMPHAVNTVNDEGGCYKIDCLEIIHIIKTKMCLIKCQCMIIYYVNVIIMGCKTPGSYTFWQLTS